jgi:1-aminocyclopropane-1-carboxylate deaminase/D-cysteine desulfhydrase-like pyridoxal-dependent ACC family enzyme
VLSTQTIAFRQFDASERTLSRVFCVSSALAFRSDETVLFWHTGGALALFAYANDLI